MSNSNHSSQSRQYASVFELNGVPKFGQALPLALQHVVAMIVGCVTPAIIVSGVAGLNERDQVILVQAALFTSAISTLLQLFPFIRFKNFQLGSALPVIMGISFAYVPSMQAIAANSDVGTILGAQLIGGFVAIIVGLAIQKIRVLFPPIITGTVVFTIGLSLYPTAVNYMAGGTSNPDYGSWKNWLAAFFTLAVVVGLNHFAKACVHPRRNHRRVYLCIVSGTRRFFRNPVRGLLPAPAATAFRTFFRSIRLHCDRCVVCHQLHSGDRRSFCYNSRKYGTGTKR